ncbi:MAG: hypothetical protein IT431_12610 [Phycisphaerales bacterium]|nr:hypothetical protein [Phycisphaerales bacterium]
MRGSSLLAVLSAIAWLTAGAPAQPYWTLDDTGNHDGVIDASAGELAVLSIWSTCPTQTAGFAQSLYQIAGDTNWQNNGVIALYDNLLDALTGEGLPGPGNTITGIDSFQLPPIFNPNFDAHNPIKLYDLVWQPTVVGSYTVSATSTHSTHDWYSDNFGTTFSCTPPYNPTITFRVIPAPGPVGLIVVCALAAARRRR